jgi:small nuclear ribonucleoprotein (snRNP)-like protein
VGSGTVGTTASSHRTPPDTLDRMTRFGYLEVEKDTELAPGPAQIREWIKERAALLILLSDGRTLHGKLLGYDQQGHIILSDATEWRDAAEGSPCPPIASPLTPNPSLASTHSSGDTGPSTSAVSASSSTVKVAATNASNTANQKKSKKKANRSKKSTDPEVNGEGGNSSIALEEFDDETQRLDLANRITDESKYERYMVRYDAENKREVRYQGLVMVAPRHIESISIDIAALPTAPLPSS